MGEIPFIKDISYFCNFIPENQRVMNSVSYCVHWPLFGSRIFSLTDRQTDRHTFRLFNVDIS